MTDDTRPKEVSAAEFAEAVNDASHALVTIHDDPEYGFRIGLSLSDGRTFELNAWDGSPLDIYETTAPVSEGDE